MNDIEERRENYPTDEQGRQLINTHGDVDVVRTKDDYPVQLPLDLGDYVRLDDEELEFRGFRGNRVKFLVLEDDSSFLCGVHKFNTDVRDADEVVVKSEVPDDV